MINLAASLQCLNTVLTQTTLRQLTCIAQAMLSMTGRLTMLGISRWTNKGGSYRTIQRFFGSVLPWSQVHWYLIRHLLLGKDDPILLAGDETVVTKSGKKTHGLDRFFSSLYGKAVPGVSFFVFSLISTQARSSYPVVIQQFVKEPKTQEQKAQAEKSQRGKTQQGKSQQGKSQQGKSQQQRRPSGRPKGSKNKNLREVRLSAQLLMMQTMIQSVLRLIGLDFPLVYCLLDGAFGHNNALQMVRQTGLHLISKLPCNASLYECYSGPQHKHGTRRKYGQKLQYDQIAAQYLKEETFCDGIREQIYQMPLRSKSFPDPLNVVVIIRTNLKERRQAHVVLFSSDLTLDYQRMIDYYRLRFQIEFNFRDAKQYWGLEDFMNVSARGVSSGANLSFFMVNLSRVLIMDFRKDHPLYSVNDLKAQCRGEKYVVEVLKLLGQEAEPILMEALLSRVSALGRVNRMPRAA